MKQHFTINFKILTKILLTCIYTRLEMTRMPSWLSNSSMGLKALLLNSGKLTNIDTESPCLWHKDKDSASCKGEWDINMYIQKLN